MIDEKKLIEEIWSKYNSRYNDATLYDADETKLINRVLSEIQRLIEAQHKVGKWIPVSERLPDKKGLYLVSHGENYSVCIEEFNGIRHFSMIHNYSQPKAWMPLPEPYKGEEE